MTSPSQQNNKKRHRENDRWESSHYVRLPTRNALRQSTLFGTGRITPQHERGLAAQRITSR